MFKVFKSIFALVLATVLLCRCFTNGRQLHNSEKWLPSGFNPRKSVLLVAYFDNKPKNGTSKGMEEYMSIHYPYRYEFVSEEMIKDRTGKYSDTAIYRYALVWTKKISRYESAKINDAHSVVGYDLHFYDLVKDKHYKPTGNRNTFTSMTYKPLVNTLVKKYGSRKNK
jgi:hypothetical protein